MSGTDYGKAFLRLSAYHTAAGASVEKPLSGRAWSGKEGTRTQAPPLTSCVT